MTANENSTVVHARYRVMIVDSSRETHDVFTTALARQGTETVACLRAAQAIDKLRRDPPDLVVFDVDSDDSQGKADTARLQKLAEEQATPLVVIGRTPNTSSSGGHGVSIGKPYHFAPVVHRIDAMLRAADRSNCAA